MALRGVLHQEAAGDRFAVRRLPPAPELAPFVDYHWVVRWDLRGRPPYRQPVLAHPHVHLVYEAGGPRVYGIDRGLFTRLLAGRGRVHGIRFTPGGFRAYSGGRPVGALADLRLPAEEFFGPSIAALNPLVLRSPEETGPAAAPLLPAPAADPQAAFAGELVAAVGADRGLLRVGQLAALAGLSVRSLQRLFHEYVGAGPKWVIRRARLHELTDRAAGAAVRDAPVDWSALAADLGYADQAHLTRDFTAATGLSPTAYAAAGR
ncbi:helix-turn-helix domain-containing protein [Phaeacidiphilus oryzae]|uniref:helix-turn-helix domain-containing protein n=1 Tax=Phaeacidiphilus oryzae TaxID=348818 RepID=UPI0005692DC9|nr:helix-turn-helix domain-containing protein [Phaeacidiphilus oryzae]